MILLKNFQEISFTKKLTQPNPTIAVANQDGVKKFT